MKYAVIVKDTITIPGDERSKTDPGHGYPEHTKNITRFHEFDDKNGLEAWLVETEKESNPPKFRVIEFNEFNISKHVGFKLTHKE